MQCGIPLQHAQAAETVLYCSRFRAKHSVNSHLDFVVAVLVDASDAECLYIGATLEVGVYLLLAAALALNLAGQVTRRLARAVGGDGAAAAKPLPEGAEAEAAARGGASAGALVVSTQI